MLIGTRSGVLGSSDGGVTWKELSAGVPDLVEVSSLLVVPDHPQTAAYVPKVMGYYRQLLARNG